ncbi:MULTISPECIES: hypothetical protein [unclassified Aeromonas]|uniref:hypothetical protein n=1 Tax=unclassified Aeromonas TaxID=257493 RepID=UPI000F9F8F63|nr:MULTISPECIES: hypothetical protein [unclassified Aeromonas]MBV7414972.1 hypothetical protein [Aeromonas sp. sif2433]MBV7436852.1 hypothetical protein [Aeromonas sp. sif2416]
MEPFNWVDIDGIRYSWDGQDSILCTGRFGYQATMTGDKISALDLENEDGEVAGSLNVDFAASSISFTPAEDALLPHMVVLVGHELGQQEYSLQSLSDSSLQDLLSHGDDFDWSSLAVITAPEPVLPSQGHVLSWDSFHFEEESLLGARESAPLMASHGSLLGSEISINIDMTNQVLDHIPPLHDI